MGCVARIKRCSLLVDRIGFGGVNAFNVNGRVAALQRSAHLLCTLGASGQSLETMYGVYPELVLLLILLLLTIVGMILPTECRVM